MSWLAALQSPAGLYVRAGVVRYCRLAAAFTALFATGVALGVGYAARNFVPVS